MKKHFWFYIFGMFIVLALVNIYQKMNWSQPTDQVMWEKFGDQVVCTASQNDEIQPGDILLTINEYRIDSTTDIHRIISTRSICNYVFERNNTRYSRLITITREYTPFAYYVLVFCGILFILLILRIENLSLKKNIGFSAPRLFYLLALSFSGFMIFSPVGRYHASDFLFLSLDRVALLFFPAFLLQFSIFVPVKSRIINRIKPSLLNAFIYSIPAVLLSLYVFFLFRDILEKNFDSLSNTVAGFRVYLSYYLVIYLVAAVVLFAISNLKLITQKKQRKFLLPLIGIVVSVMVIIRFQMVPLSDNLYSYMLLVLLMFLPLSITFLLSHKRFSNIENIIRRTIAIASIFIFVFGINIFLGVNFERNKFLGLFWSVTAILTAGLLFKPIEKNVQNLFEKLFMRGPYKFKVRLTELMQSLTTERDLLSLSASFLNTINKGLNLKNSTLLINKGDNDFVALPSQQSITLPRPFILTLLDYDYLIFHNQSEFIRKYKDASDFFLKNKYLQFLPLKTQDKLIGIIGLGLKNDDTFLSVDDWEVLFNVSSSLTLSVENASLYTELENQFNEISLLKDFNENIVTNINLGIMVLSGDGAIVFWNYKMEQLFSIAAEEAVRTDPVQIFGPDRWKRFRNEGPATLLQEKIAVADQNFLFDIRISPLRDSSRNNIGTILVFEDITDRVNMQNQLITTEKMASIGLLSSGIAHEINTPLTGISSYCQFLIDNPTDPNNRVLVERMLEQVQRANRIVKSLLDFARQKGKTEKPTRFDLVKTINNSVSLLEHKLKKKNITISRNLKFNTDFFGYPSRVQQVFVNLIINAVDAIHHGRGKITIDAHEDNTDFIIRFKDNGKGISKEDMKNIFDPFFTTKSIGKGTGLGLSIVYNIVEEHYGKITVNSILEKGTTFYLTFPKRSPLRSVKL